MGGVEETTGVGEIKGSSIDGVSGDGNVGSTVGVAVGGIVDTVGVDGGVVVGDINGDDVGIAVGGGVDGAEVGVIDGDGWRIKVYSFFKHISVSPYEYCSIFSLRSSLRNTSISFLNLYFFASFIFNRIFSIYFELS